MKLEGSCPSAPAGPPDASELLRQLDETRAERDSARRALAEMTEQRAHFHAYLGHELRTPLNAINGYAELLSLVADNPARTRRAAESIREAGGHLLSMVEAVLDMARIRAGTFELKEENVQLADVVQRSLSLVAGLAESRRVKLATRVPTSLPAVRGDARLLAQVLINLASNAVKVSPSGGQVVISAQKLSKGRVALCVRDEGPGIAPENIKRILQPFEQVDPARDGKLGTGIGLALVRMFTELHDGDFQLMSDVGRGTTAMVVLPSARVIHSPRRGQQHEFRFVRTGG